MNDERDLKGLLAKVRRRWLSAALMQALARGALGIALVVLASAIADLWFGPRDLSLVALGLASVAGMVGLTSWAVWPLRRRPSDRQVARFVEERCPELEDRLASAAALVAHLDQGPMRRLVIADAATRARQVDPRRVVPRETMRRAAWRAGLGVVVLLACGWVGWAPASRAIGAARGYVMPGSLAVEVRPGNARVVAGRPFRVRARLVGPPSTVGSTSPTITFTTADGQVSRPMSPAGDGFEFEVPAVATSFTYHVSAARVASAEFTVTALFPPRVTRIDVDYEYPAFTGLQPRTETDGGDIFAPLGTRVRVRVMADKPIRTAALVMSDGAQVTLDASAGADLEGGLQVTGDGSYRVALSDTDGLDSAGDTEYFIRVMDDRPPDVRILRPAGDRTVTMLEEVPVEARAEDDYGVATFELVYAVRGGEERVVNLAGRGEATSRTGSHLFYLEDLGVQPGDFVSYYARARDVGRGKRSSEARSDIYFLEVKPFDGEFELARSQAGAGGGATSVDNLVRAQKDIISATWKLDRRQQGGRSEIDIGAVARAQGELRSQAESAAAGAGRGADARRRGSRMAGDAAVALEAAAAAMGRAQDELEALRTSPSLPHQMEALNQLLRAQADIRRWQVSRSQAGGGGGSDRPDRDLSALFDRELQRQQQTNYETPEAARQTPGEEQQDALDEIRELARRQNELSRQQRDLTQADLEEAELTRQLERLTREQNELRQRVEELSRQMAELERRRPNAGAGQQRAPDAASSGLESGSTGPPSGREVRDRQMRGIADEMRSATSDLRRQDLESASARSARAADALRRLEDELGRAEPDVRRRTLGELSLEVRRLADAQRRVAGEARQLPQQEADDAANTRARLADEKDRQADRMQEVERAAAALGGTGGADEALIQALGQIEREAVARRMRESAQAMRQASASALESGRDAAADVRLADTERQLTDALSRIADAMQAVAGSAGDQITRDLADRLARAGELRDRLDALEREIARTGREAQGSQTGERPDPSAAPAPGDAPRPGERPGPARGEGAAERLARLQQEYARELQQAQDLMDDIRREGGAGRGLSPEDHQYTMGAPGTQAFKQDFSRWESLRQTVALALERYEQELSERLAAALAEDRLNAGASVEVPEAYRALVARYFEALAKKRKQ